MKILTNNERLVLAYLRGKDFVSPTVIGHALNPSSIYGSPWASPICKRLVKWGYLLRSSKGHYKLITVKQESK